MTFFGNYNQSFSTGSSQLPIPTVRKDPFEVSSSHNHEQTTQSTPDFVQWSTISSEIASRLIPIDVDLHAQKNTTKHSTNHYDIPGLVLRRGQPFSFSVTFNKNYDAEQYQLYVRLAIGSRSMMSKHTQIRILVNESSSSANNGWSAKLIPTESDKTMKANNNRISVQVDSPSNATIGKYNLLLEVRSLKRPVENSPSQNKTNLFLVDVGLYFLFNPWNKNDTCSLSSARNINEYVMNEHGQIFLGTSNKPHAIPWYFGQFERPVLLAALTLLDTAQLSAKNRIDPAVVLRALSSKICSSPGSNNGIFPSAFDTEISVVEGHGYTNSTGILKQYLLSNQQSLKGGCGTSWQHAAVLCSLSRSLGIPCRIVTIYDAAYQIDGTRDNDMHWDTKQRPLKQLNLDIIRSTHVWNECWMRRMDLPYDEQDWQVIDPTPIQMHDGMRGMGPCSVSLLKNDEFCFRSDSPFIQSTIRGNKSNWLVQPDGYMELLDVKENVIGTKIITRSLTNELKPKHLTNQYKPSAMLLKNKQEIQYDVDFKLNIPDDLKFGDRIVIDLNANNISFASRTITTALTICIMNSNNRKVIASHAQQMQTLDLAAGKNETIQMKINPEQYMNYGRQENIIVKYYLHSLVKETNQTYIHDDNIVFNFADIIKLTLEEDVVEIGKPVILGIQLSNILTRRINSGHVYIDGFGINKMIPINLLNSSMFKFDIPSRSLASKESIKFHAQLYPTRIGVSRLYATFRSNDFCSSTQIVSLEIVQEPIKEKNSLRPDIDAEELKITGGKNSASPINESDTEDMATNDTKEILLSTAESTTISESSKSSVDFEHHFEIETCEDDANDEDDNAYKHYSKDKYNCEFSNDNKNSSFQNAEKSSSDKDKLSMDSLDAPIDHSLASNHNEN